MSSNNPKVACQVEECTHWMDGGQCMAEKIAIYNNEAVSSSQTSADTQCKSFHAGRGMGDYVGALHNADVSGSMKAAVVDGVQINPAVDCYVDNCKYWHQGNACNATGIEVNGMKASTTNDTDCATFEAQ